MGDKVWQDVIGWWDVAGGENISTSPITKFKVLIEITIESNIEDKVWKDVILSLKLSLTTLNRYFYFYNFYFSMKDGG